jgi:hypothetical protein
MDTRTHAMPVTSWEEFSSAYGAAHRNPVNRWIHHATHLGVAVGSLLLFTGHAGWAALLILGSLPVNWASHLVFERNTPAFFAPADAWGKVQVALGGLAWTVATLPRDLGITADGARKDDE